MSNITTMSMNTTVMTVTMMTTMFRRCAITSWARRNITGKKSFQEEYRVFLERHGVVFDERYVWD